MVLLANGSSGVSSAQYGSQLANLRYFVYDKGVQAFQYNVAFEMIIENESSQGLNLTSAGKLKMKFVFGKTGLRVCCANKIFSKTTVSAMFKCGGLSYTSTLSKFS